MGEGGAGSRGRAVSLSFPAEGFPPIGFAFENQSVIDGEFFAVHYHGAFRFLASQQYYQVVQ